MEKIQETVTAPTGAFDLVILRGLQPLQNNVYILTDPATGECVVIDASETAPILAALDGRQVRGVLLTHGHHDHHAGLPALRAHLGSGEVVGIGEPDAAMLESPPTFHLADGQQVTFGPHTLQAISTPGHTPGSTCFLIGDTLFSGDTLFPGGPGNTDPASNPWGDFPTIMTSLRQRLFTLPDHVRVLPGHGLDTTLAAERPHLEEWNTRGW